MMFLQSFAVCLPWILIYCPVIHSFAWKELRQKVIKGALVAISITSAANGPVYSDTEEWTDRNRLAANVWRAIDESYIDRSFNGNDWFKLRQEVVKRKYKSDDEVYKSLQTMISKLGDRYTRYLTPAQYSSLLSSTQGELIGLGLELAASTDGRTQVIRVEPDSPAYNIGLLKGDYIVNVEGQDAKNLSPEEVAATLRGKANTKASVRVDRNGQLLDFATERQPIKVKGVSSKVVTLKNNNQEEKIAIVKIRSFGTSTLEEVTKTLESLYSKNNAIDKIIVDLRDNGGGLLQGAIDTSNLFMVPGKIVVFVVNKDGLSEAKLTLPSGIPSNDPNLPILTTPLYILVNSNTASAAEVFAAGLQENSRAKIIGEKTFGKGIIQNVQEISEGGGVSITIARYETPLHHNINKIGIKPDLESVCRESSETIESCFIDNKLVLK